ncbi:MAG: hypothetical protein ACOY9D_06430 [Pseudomonadota bacterium]
MKAAIVLTFLAIFISGCGKSADPREDQKRLMQIPGYKEAKRICTQCHKLPFQEQHVSAAWPDVIARMEGYMRANKRMMPTQQERDAITAFYQSSPN